MPCEVCLDLKNLGRSHRWNLRARKDLTWEYTLEFSSSQLEQASRSGCRTCSIVLEGLQVITRESSILDMLQPYQGHFILQQHHPLEIEITTRSEELKLKGPQSSYLRIQIYSNTGTCI